LSLYNKDDVRLIGLDDAAAKLGIHYYDSPFVF